MHTGALPQAFPAAGVRGSGCQAPAGQQEWHACRGNSCMPINRFELGVSTWFHLAQQHRNAQEMQTPTCHSTTQGLALQRQPAFKKVNLLCGSWCNALLLRTSLATLSSHRRRRRCWVAAAAAAAQPAAAPAAAARHPAVCLLPPAAARAGGAALC